MDLESGSFPSHAGVVAPPARQSRLQKAKSENSARVRERKRRTSSVSHPYKTLVRATQGSVPFLKPKLYTQASFLGPINCEPFSTFKRPIAMDESQGEDEFPSALCEAVGCWQTEPHTHDISEVSKSKGDRYGMMDAFDHVTAEVDCPDLQTNHRVVDDVAEKSASARITRATSASSRTLRSTHTTLEKDLQAHAGNHSCGLPFKQPPRSKEETSLLGSSTKGSRDLRSALPRVSPTVKEPNPQSPPFTRWEVSLPIHLK